MAKLTSAFTKSLALSQIYFYAGTLICVLVAPNSLSANTGLSYFGVHRYTAPIFGAGMLAGAYFIFQAANSLALGGKNLRWLPSILKLVALLMAAIVATPYSVNNWFDWVHTACGTVLFLLQLFLAIWLVWQRRRDWLNWLLLAAQVGGGIIALIYLAPSQGFLMQGQLIFQLAFSVILFRALLDKNVLNIT